MNTSWIDRKTRIARDLFATAILLTCGMGRGAVAVPPAAAPINLPDFARNVRVSVGGESLALDAAMAKAATDQRIVTYRQLRAEAGNFPDGPLQLARWCRKQGLADEERLHWQLLLMMHPRQPDAMKGLGLRDYDGQLMTNDQIAAAKKESKLTKETERKWTSTIKRLKLALEQDDVAVRQAALDELEAIRDPRVMALIERTLSDDSTAVALLVADMYGRAATQQSTNALVRLALHAKQAAVREKAAGELRYRPPEKYMPALVGALTAPIELNVRRDVERGGPTAKWWDTYYYTGRLVKGGMYAVIRLDGNYTSRDMVYWWGPETKPFSGWLITGYIPDRHQVEYVLTGDSPDPETPYEFHGGFEASSNGPDGRQPASIERSIAALGKRIREVNAKSAETNIRVDAAIREATQASAASDQPAKVDKAADVRPRLWWDWWKRQLELNNYFAKGTEVWTQLGIRPIEEVLIGDRVLTKNLKTGDLTFNLVIGTDMQRNCDVNEIEVGGRRIVATVDQPFFVTDGRWRKAKELTPEMELDGLSGKLRIESTRAGTADETYSLLIADQSNYFVDRYGVWVHDATRK